MAVRGSRNIGENRNPQVIEVSEKQIEIFARRLLPEINKFFADENVQKEFAEWREKRQKKDVQ